MMRRLLRRVKERFSIPRPSMGALVAVLGVSLVIAGVAGGAFGAPAPSVPAVKAPVYAASWTLADFVRHADAGEVLMIARGTSQARDQSGAPVAVLGVKTTDGQWIELALSQTSAEAITALRALGYGRLMSEDTISSVTAQVSPSSGNGWSGMLLLLGFAILLGFGARAVIRSHSASGETATAGGGGSGGARFRTYKPEGDTRDRGAPILPATTFADVAGVEVAKAELMEVVEFLRDPTRFTRLGAKIPRGVMFYGPPGTGKTLLAKAVASEAGVAFTPAAGSDFVEKFVGVGAQRIRQIFAQARAAGRGVIFIDEIDAIAAARSGDGNSREHDQTINALLTEMDGFSTTDEVIVLAATNRLDMLDEAVLRPGRFSRKIAIPLPDTEARLAILEVHAKGKPLGSEVDLASLARRTGGFSGATLADMLNEAAIFAARRGADEISAADVDAGWTKSAIGVGLKRSMPLRERAIIAAHEAGHAICGRLHSTSRTVERISMFRHGDALGYTLSSSGDDLLPSERQLRAQIVALMGGRAAEALLFTDNTGGASNDFEKANAIAEAMVTRYGFGADPATAGGVTGRGSLGYLIGGMRGTLRGAEAEAAVTRAIAAILDEAYGTAVDTLRANLGMLERVAAFLVEVEEMSGEEFAAVCEGTLSPSDEAMETWLVTESSPRERGSIVAGGLTTASPGRSLDPMPAPARPAPSVRPAAAAPSPARRGEPRRASRRPSVRGLLGSGLRGAAAYVEGRRGRAKDEDEDEAVAA